jgi:alpha-amylase
VGGFSVGEYWDANVNTLNGGQIMPTALYLTLRATTMNDAFDVINLNLLNDDVEKNPYKAVTFVIHDTDEIDNKQLAYAYILTHEGYPTLFTKITRNGSIKKTTRF